jgi:hypothetical protein
VRFRFRFLVGRISLNTSHARTHADIYSDVAGQSAMISDLLRKLLLKVRKEINFQEQSLRLLGTLDMLINSAVAAAALPAPLSA